MFYLMIKLLRSKSLRRYTNTVLNRQSFDNTELHDLDNINTDKIIRMTNHDSIISVENDAQRNLEKIDLVK